MTKIVLFKSEAEGSDIFVEALKHNKFEVQSIASIDFAFKNLDILNTKLKTPDNYEGIIFTSPRSIIATQQSLKGDNVIDQWIDKRNFSVGESTYSLAKNLLNLETNGKESGNAKNLSTIIINTDSTSKIHKPFLFPCGNLKQDILEKNLSDHSVKVESVEVYETVPHPNLDNAIKQLKEDNDTDYIVYFSPSGIKYSLPLIRKHELELSKIKLIAIGPSTKGSMLDNNLECYAMCDKPSPESLLNILRL